MKYYFSLPLLFIAAIIIGYYAKTIPFIYDSKVLVTVLAGYITLTGFVVFILLRPRMIDKINAQKDRYKFKLRFLAFFIIFPLIVGFFIANLVVIPAALIASEFSINSFKVTKLMGDARLLAFYKRVHIVDRNGKESSFLLPNSIVFKLGLQKGSKLEVIGRSCSIGLKIENINGIEIK